MLIAFDFETHLIAPGCLAPKAVCLTWQDDSGNQGILVDPEEIESLILSWLKDPECILVGANTAFDVGVSMANYESTIDLWFYAYENDRVTDVQIIAKMRDNARGILGVGPGAKGYSLATLEERYFGRDRSVEKTDPMAWRLRYSELDGVPLDQWPQPAIQYALDDATGTLDVMEYLVNQGLPVDHWNQSRAALALHLMTCWGMKTDPNKIRQFEIETKAKYTELRAHLQSVGFVRKDGSRNTKLAKERILDDYRVTGRDVKLTKTGRDLFEGRPYAVPYDQLMSHPDPKAMTYVALDEEACTESEDQDLQSYAEYTSIQSIMDSTIPQLWLGVNTPLQPQFEVMLETGRTSCRQGKGGPTNGFQTQNVRRAKGIRECFVARPGTYIADCDFSQLELCTVAQVCKTLLGWSTLGDMLNQGADVHLFMGANILGISYQEAIERKRDKDVKEARQLAKVANFGFPGGLGAGGFVAFAKGYGLKVTKQQGEDLRQVWIETFPEFLDYFLHIRKLIDPVEEVIPVQTFLFTGLERGNVSYTQACNGYFQALGAAGAKAACFDVAKACYAQPESPLYNSKPINFVHDQILAEVPIDTAHEAAHELARVMVESCNRYLPDVPVKCEPALSIHWSKDTIPAYDANGRLIPWDLDGVEKFDKDGKVIQ